MQTILVAGASGMLGSRIAHYLLDHPNTQVRLLVRKGNTASEKGAQRISPLVARGAQTVEGDLTDPDSLDRATEGVNVVVSAVQGGEDIIFDGQLTLLEAAKRNGVRRILPSDFALDLFKAPEGEHINFNMRRKADEVIAASGLEHIHVLNGAFMDNFLDSQFGGVFDMDSGIASYWGDGADRFDATSVEDTARYAAFAALDRDLPNGKFAIAAQQLTFAEVINSVEQVAHRRFERRSHGTVAELHAQIEANRSIDPSSMEVLGNTYILYMLNGQTALTDLQNDRYPNVVPEDYVDHVRRTWETRQ